MDYERLIELANYLYNNQQSDKRIFSFNVAPSNIESSIIHKRNMLDTDRFLNYKPEDNNELLSIVHVTREMNINDSSEIHLRYTYDIHSKIENMGAHKWVLKDKDMHKELQEYFKYAAKK
ncbi:hypothetical protein CJD36_002575 [Flavipsychrobacter stenotrophus]|uniref:Uncharacterized protein n=1 Tax=Flavipsychrobacter stenotrophus TaxID=2077091 RepID=A0A2S7T1B7_9BACT|nr:hypothetical protein [Flavipsychrobacter stenotrophus]PQJ12647.1 hypothetical protein CJD36_002575 [Flavipsychrobacter stenotrophus]